MPAIKVVPSGGSVPSAAAESTRRLIVTWQHPVERSICPVGALYYDGSSYRYYYLQNVKSVPDFRPFLGFPDLATTYESPNLFALFSQRAMAPRRPDYTQWVTRLGLDDDATPLEQIARSGGRREGDTIQLFPEPRIEGELMTCSFLVHGVRHVLEKELTVDGVQITVSRNELEAELARLQAGDDLVLIDETDNPVNPRAILTTSADRVPLGWVPNLLVEDLHRVPRRSSISVKVRQVNGPDAGWHLRLLAQLTATVPAGFEVFRGNAWEPYTVR